MKELHYVKENPGTIAWSVLGSAALAYNFLCPPHHTLSETVDRALERHRAPTTLAIGYTALHLLNMLPRRLDAFTILTERFKDV